MAQILSPWEFANWTGIIGLKWTPTFSVTMRRKPLSSEKDFKGHVKYVDNAVTRDACFELNEELVWYLVHRYPNVYRLKAGKVHNSLTGEEFSFPAGTVNFFFSLCNVRG